MRSLALVAPPLALALAALYALGILPLVEATRILTFSDQSCRTSSGSISAKDSPGSGECTKLTSGYTSFMIGELGDGCAGMSCWRLFAVVILKPKHQVRGS